MFEFLLFEGFSNMVLASALEPLRDVSLRGVKARLSWRISTLDGGAVRSSSGLTVTPDGAFDPAAGATLVLVAGYRTRDQLAPGALNRIRQAARAAPLVVATDTSPWILAATGLLDNHEATIHWHVFDAFQETFPRVEVSSAGFVRSGKFLTCGGASTTLDMMLDLIQNQFGAAAAFEASNMFLYDPNRQARGPQRLRDRGSPKLLAALDTMANHIETPLTTFELADQVGAGGTHPQPAVSKRARHGARHLLPAAAAGSRAAPGRRNHPQPGTDCIAMRIFLGAWRWHGRFNKPTSAA